MVAVAGVDEAGAEEEPEVDEEAGAEEPGERAPTTSLSTSRRS